MSGTPDYASLAKTSLEKAHKVTVEGLKAQISQLQGVIKEQEAQIDVIAAIQAQPSVIGEFKPLKIGGGEATAVLLASDWHVEEEVTLASTNGLNEFNLEIADDRIKKLFTSFVRLTDIQRHGTKITNALVNLGGDLMTGWIHEELRESNALTPLETILWLKERVELGLRYIANNFDHVTVVCNYGNHGRTTIKPRHATGFKNSYEWLLYNIISKEPEFAGENFSWVIADAYFAYVEVYHFLGRFHHGDGLKYQGGIGGLTIPVEKAIASWNRGRVASLDCFGHWHQGQQNPKWVSNSSLIGYNAYAIAIKAAMEPPSQTFFLMDKKRGRTLTTPIYLN